MNTDDLLGIFQPPPLQTVYSLVENLDGTEGKTLTIKKLLPERQPLERETRVHHVYSVASMKAYLDRYGTSNTLVFCDTAHHRSAVAVLDETDASRDHPEHVTYPFINHPLWHPWEVFIGVWKKLDEMVDFLRDNEGVVVAPEGAKLTRLLSQVTLSKSVELYRGQGLKSMNGLVVTTKVAGQESSQPVELPEVITLNAPVVIGTSPIDIQLSLQLRERDDVVLARLTGQGTSMARQRAVEGIADALEQACLTSGWTFCEGEPQYLSRQWRELR